LARVGQCRLTAEGVAAVQQKYRQGRWGNVPAFCDHIGIARSTYYELIGRKVWFEQATLQDKLAAIGLAQDDYERFCEYREHERELPRSPQASASNLPLQPSSFVGRESEVAQVRRLLGQTRLLTLVGAGGSGKTRLSLRVAAELLEAYPDGVWQIELAPLTDAALVAQTLATALGLREQPGQPLIQTLTDFLRPRTALLLLDNCEHLMAPCAQLAASLLRACPAVTLLATSREALRVAGEVVWQVPPLSLPDGERLQRAEAEWMSVLLASDAVRLFVERAQAHRLDFALSASNGALVAEVCRRLDGIPLAIELAAARLRTMTVEQLAQRLDRCLQVLTGGERTASPRQQTLRALIDWSYDLLEPAEKALLGRLSVFAGGWTLEAAMNVCPGEGIEDWEVLDLLTGLADKSLVAFEERGEVGRYRLLEAIHQYARERLQERSRQRPAQPAEPETWRRRHRDLYLLLAEEARAQLRESDPSHWFGVLEAEHDNLRQALTYCLEAADGGEAGLRLGVALQPLWGIRGYVSEGRLRLNAILSRPAGRDHPKLWAEALHGAGALAYMQGDYREARLLNEQSLTIRWEIGDRQDIADSLNALGLVIHGLGEYVAACSLLEESLSIRQELQDRRGIADSLNHLGLATYEQGDHATAKSLLEESLSLYRALGDRRGIALSLHIQGRIAGDQNELDIARSRFEESLHLLRELGDRRHIAWSLLNLGRVVNLLGDHALALTRLEESLRHFNELGDRSGIAWSVLNLGYVAQQQGDDATAQRRFEESLGLFIELGDKRGASYAQEALAP
jgi:predicted ATPase/Tfp pilus assembly protein PilF